MKKFLLIAILAFPVIGLVSWVVWGTKQRVPVKKPVEVQVEKTVKDRLQQYGPEARARLKPYFEAKQVAYPPVRLTLVGLKEEKTLELYAGGSNQKLEFIRAYPILAASGVAGPKLRQGDKQVPEGIYPVEWLNPNSSYHLSFRIGYPNEFDREHAQSESRTNLGGDIMIHGDTKSVGCLAMGDPASEDLFVLAADTGITNITIILSPVDFRKGKTVEITEKLPKWTPGLYETIKAKLNELPVNN
ncbi:MAG: uncharacterized protein JWQ71_4793 [Pedosphaera sp.]|nr:uncharacterized protein [Pedosphaera sp.]